jgi:hypothetical protein
MTIEIPSLAESKTNFRYKINAALFFIGEIKQIYIPESTYSKDIPNKLFYFVDGAIFELHAASQILLQIINVKSKINCNANEVNGGRKYQEKLKIINIQLYNWWQSFNNSPEFHTLEAMRQHIAHRGGTFLPMDLDSNSQTCYVLYVNIVYTSN